MKHGCLEGVLIIILAGEWGGSGSSNLGEKEAQGLRST